MKFYPNVSTQHIIYIYIYVCVCVCVCVLITNNREITINFYLKINKLIKLEMKKEVDK